MFLLQLARSAHTGMQSNSVCDTTFGFSSQASHVVFCIYILSLVATSWLGGGVWSVPLGIILRPALCVTRLIHLGGIYTAGRCTNERVARKYNEGTSGRVVSECRDDYDTYPAVLPKGAVFWC